MSKLSKPPLLKPFKLALIQLGNISANKNDNIKHAREMIMKAASAKPDLIVLPASIYLLANVCALTNLLRSASILRTGTSISQCTLRE